MIGHYLDFSLTILLYLNLPYLNFALSLDSLIGYNLSCGCSWTTIFAETSIIRVTLR